VHLQSDHSKQRELLSVVLATLIPVWVFLIPFALLASAQTSLRDADAFSLSVAALFAAPIAVALTWFTSRRHGPSPLGLILAMGLAGVLVEVYVVVFG
jgi:hypothetical protein